MGIRTVGFEKTRIASSREKNKDPDNLEEKKEKKNESDVNTSVAVQNSEEIAKTASTDETLVKTAAPGKVNSRAGSPLKVRTPSSMARLGMKAAAARKLKKQRKRRLFVRVTNKINLRSSIRATRTRRPLRAEENAQESKNVNITTMTTAPSRFSTRMSMRRCSREGIPDAPLRTVELITRPLELREPATKLLYMASLGLYPTTGESDMTEVVIVQECSESPGKKNGPRKSLELPFMPVRKRILDLAKSARRDPSENLKPQASKQGKRDSRKSSPVSALEKPEPIQLDKNQNPEPKRTPRLTPSPKAMAETNSLVANNYTKATVDQFSKNKPLNGTVKSLEKSSDLTIAATKISARTASLTASAVVQDMSRLTSGVPNPKSLLKNNLSSPPIPTKNEKSFNGPINFMQNISTKHGVVKTTPPLLTPPPPQPAFNVTNAMNLLMSSITILPANQAASFAAQPMKRPSSSSTIVNEANKISPISFMEVPSRKKQKTNKLSLPPSITVKTSSASEFQNNVFLQPTQSENTEALNLCLKRNIDAPSLSNLLPPRLQNKSNVNGWTNLEGTKPMNLIIPRPPPPLTKAPLDLASFSQNIHPIQSMKPKKARKPRSNYNQRNQSTMQLPLLPALAAHLPNPTEAAIHAKSYLKCMNGEENAYGREKVEPMDSVKTMLSRLQTRIGPAVNGVRLITIE